MIERYSSGPAPETVRLLTQLDEQQLYELLDRPEQLQQLRDWGIEPPTPEQLHVFLTLRACLSRDIDQLQQEREQMAAWLQQRKVAEGELTRVQENIEALQAEVAALKDQGQQLQAELTEAQTEAESRISPDRQALRNALDHALAVEVMALTYDLPLERICRSQSLRIATSQLWERVGLIVAIADACGLSPEQLVRDANLQEVLRLCEQFVRQQLEQSGYRFAVAGATFGSRVRERRRSPHGGSTS